MTEIYSINYPNGFCGSWLQWLLTEHKEFANKRSPQYHEYFHYKSFDNTNTTVRVAGNPGLWLPSVIINETTINELKTYWPEEWPPMLSFDEYVNKEKYNIIAPKIAVRVGVSHTPSSLKAPILKQFINLGLKFIIVTISDPTHLKYIKNRINAYAPVVNLNNSIENRLSSIRMASTVLVKIPKDVYTFINVGKLVFDKDINEYKKLCEFTGIELNTTVFNNMADEFVNTVWLPHMS